MYKNYLLITFVLIGVIFFTFCEKNKVESNNSTIPVYVTNPSKSALLWQTTATVETELNTNLPTIVVDETKNYQSVDGFGFTLTGGSASLIGKLEKSAKDSLLIELFGKSEHSIGISYLRISLGASDLSESVFTYNDLPSGNTDINLDKFNLSADTIYLIPLLKEILKINPSIKLLASPWTAPIWMKSNKSSVGGYLLPEYYDAYSRYFVKYIKAMNAYGIPIDAITVQNEPQHGGNNPSMVMSSTEQATFVKNNLGPALKNANLSTKIIIWDHNCDNPNYPISILNDANANSFIDGSAFHLYAGDIAALSAVHDAFPNKNLYFTEQWTGSNGDFGGDLKWHTKNVIIGSMRNWSKNALEWNLASDPFYNPHTPGGCSQCKGAITIDNNTITRNVSYYIIGQASKFVPTGSKVIYSSTETGFSNVAFETPDKKKVLLLLNETTSSKKINISNNNNKFSYSISPGSVATFIW